MMRSARVWVGMICGCAAGIASPAQAACPASLVDLRAQLTASEAAFASMDNGAFKGAVAAMRSDIACLASAPDPRLVAEVDEVEALDAYFDQDQGRALLSLRAMVEIWPAATLSPDLAPEGGELRAWLAMAARVPPTPRTRVAVPAGTTLIVDGTASAELSPDRPSLVVLMDAWGEVRWSGLYVGAAALPELGSAPPEVAAVPTLAPAPTPTRFRKPVLLAAGGMALLSGGLLAGGLHASAQVEQVGAAIAAGKDYPGISDRDALDALADRANALGIAGQIAGGLALGGCVVGLAVRW